MKILKNKRKLRIAKINAKIHIEYRKRYEKQLEDMQLEKEIEIEDQQKFYNKAMAKVRETEKNKWVTILNERDGIIKNLQLQLNEKKDLFQYLKNREQELENVINLIGTKYKAFAELVESGYGGIQQTFGHLLTYNRHHLKKDEKIIEAIKE